MIWTDSQGSVWISGQLVCRDAFPQHADMFWLPQPPQIVFSGHIASGQIGCSPCTTSGVGTHSGGNISSVGGYPYGSSLNPIVSRSKDPNPFYRGYDSLE